MDARCPRRILHVVALVFAIAAAARTAAVAAAQTPRINP